VYEMFGTGICCLLKLLFTYLYVYNFKKCKIICFLTPFLGIYKNFCSSIIIFLCTLHLAPRRDSKPGP
jgi:hypothetical protein